VGTNVLATELASLVHSVRKWEASGFGIPETPQVAGKGIAAFVQKPLQLQKPLEKFRTVTGQ